MHRSAHRVAAGQDRQDLIGAGLVGDDLVAAESEIPHEGCESVNVPRIGGCQRVVERVDFFPRALTDAEGPMRMRLDHGPIVRIRLEQSVIGLGDGQATEVVDFFSLMSHQRVEVDNQLQFPVDHRAGIVADSRSAEGLRQISSHRINGAEDCGQVLLYRRPVDGHTRLCVVVGDDQDVLLFDRQGAHVDVADPGTEQISVAFALAPAGQGHGIVVGVTNRSARAGSGGTQPEFRVVAAFFGTQIDDQKFADRIGLVARHEDVDLEGLIGVQRSDAVPGVPRTVGPDDHAEFRVDDRGGRLRFESVGIESHAADDIERLSDAGFRTILIDDHQVGGKQARILGIAPHAHLLRAAFPAQSHDLRVVRRGPFDIGILLRPHFVSAGIDHNHVERFVLRKAVVQTDAIVIFKIEIDNAEFGRGLDEERRRRDLIAIIGAVEPGGPRPGSLRGDEVEAAGAIAVGIGVTKNVAPAVGFVSMWNVEWNDSDPSVRRIVAGNSKGGDHRISGLEQQRIQEYFRFRPVRRFRGDAFAGPGLGRRAILAGAGPGPLEAALVVDQGPFELARSRAVRPKAACRDAIDGAHHGAGGVRLVTADEPASFDPDHGRSEIGLPGAGEAVAGRFVGELVTAEAQIEGDRITFEAKFARPGFGLGANFHAEPCSDHMAGLVLDIFDVLDDECLVVGAVLVDAHKARAPMLMPVDFDWKVTRRAASCLFDDYRDRRPPDTCFDGFVAEKHNPFDPRDGSIPVNRSVVVARSERPFRRIAIDKLQNRLEGADHGDRFP